MSRSAHAKPGKAGPSRAAIQLLPDMPTPERCRQAPVALVEERDPAGWPVAHCRAIDTLGRMVRSGLLEPHWATAGNRFRRDFHAAHFEPLSAGDLNRARGAGGRETVLDSVEDARERVWDALRRLGGMNAPAGSVLWHVVGAEMTLRDWSLRQVWGAGRTIRQEVATGILVGALGALSGHYAERRRAETAQAARGR